MRKKHPHILYFFFFILCVVSAQQVSAQKDSASITINLRDASIDEFTRQIELQTNYRLYYYKPLFDSIRITANIPNSTPEEILKQAD